MIAGIIIAVELERAAFAATHQIYFYYSFEARVDALLIGCGLALWAKNGGALTGWFRGRMSWLLPAGGLVLSTVMPAALLPTIGDTAAAWCSALLIVQTIAARPRILNNRITDYLGARSYSLYLYHVLVRVVYVGVVPGSKGPDYSVHGHLNQLAIILLSIGAASLSYQYVERPFLAGKGGKVWQNGPLPQAATP
jgi:peptidoglycan/LPS O-acetylase OafA/YrhL